MGQLPGKSPPRQSPIVWHCSHLRCHEQHPKSQGYPVISVTLVHESPNVFTKFCISIHFISYDSEQWNVRVDFSEVEWHPAAARGAEDLPHKQIIHGVNSAHSLQVFILIDARHVTLPLFILSSVSLSTFCNSTHTALLHVVCWNWAKLDDKATHFRQSECAHT